MRKRVTIRGVDLDAIEMLAEVREETRTATGALVGEAIRYWYERLPAGEGSAVELPPAGGDER